MENVGKEVVSGRDLKSEMRRSEIVFHRDSRNIDVITIDYSVIKKVKRLDQRSETLSLSLKI